MTCCFYLNRGHLELLQVNELKAWITDHRLEDEEFMTVVRGKKVDLVKYVQKRLRNLP
jgi:hypothetical protein